MSTMYSSRLDKNEGKIPDVLPTSIDVMLHQWHMHVDFLVQWCEGFTLISPFSFVKYLFIAHLGFLDGSVVKNPPASAEDMDSIHGSRIVPGEENFNTL